MKRIICLLLCLCFLTAGLTACAKTGDSSKNTGTEKPNDSGNPTESGTDESPDVPEIVSFKDENGVPADYNIMVRAARYEYLWWDDENTSDTLQKSVWSRNVGIEEKYGVLLGITEMTDTAAAFATQLAGATGAFDLVCFDYYWKLEQQGYFYDLATMDGIDLTQSYWYHGWNNNTTINGVAYTAVGDASLEVLQNIEVMFFNRTMATGHDLDLYGLVDDNQWTVDKLMEVNASVAQNLDDANAQNQIYGALYDRHSFRAALFAAGLKLTEMAENGAVQIIADRQTNYDIADKISALIHSKEVNFADINCRVRDWSLFKNGQALFFATALFRGNELRTANLTFDYGIVVAPKFTEEDKYISTNYGASVFGIPLDCRDARMSALILSALNYYSTDSVVTTYYDQVLRQRVGENPENARMIDLARENVYVDFAFIYEFGGLLSAFYTAVRDNKSSSGEVASVLDSAQPALDELIAGFHQ